MLNISCGETTSPRVFPAGGQLFPQRPGCACVFRSQVVGLQPTPGHISLMDVKEIWERKHLSAKAALSTERACCRRPLLPTAIGTPRHVNCSSCSSTQRQKHNLHSLSPCKIINDSCFSVAPLPLGRPHEQGPPPGFSRLAADYFVKARVRLCF